MLTYFVWIFHITFSTSGFSIHYVEWYGITVGTAIICIDTDVAFVTSLIGLATCVAWVIVLIWTATGVALVAGLID